MGYTPGGGEWGKDTPRAQKEEPGWEQLKGRREVKGAGELGRGGQLTEMQSSQGGSTRLVLESGSVASDEWGRIWGLRLSPGSACDRLPFLSFSFLR